MRHTLDSARITVVARDRADFLNLLDLVTSAYDNPRHVETFCARVALLNLWGN